MLKIKDNIDINILIKKYGFTPHYSCDPLTGKTKLDYLVHAQQTYEWGRGGLAFNFISIAKNKKHIAEKILFIKDKIIFRNTRKVTDKCERHGEGQLYHDENDTAVYIDLSFVDVDLLYDLIKDGLIEKIDSKYTWSELNEG